MDAPTLALQDTAAGSPSAAAARPAKPRGAGLDTAVGTEFAALLMLAAPVATAPAGGASPPPTGQGLPPGGNGSPMPGCGLAAGGAPLPSAVPAPAPATQGSPVDPATADDRLAALAALMKSAPPGDGPAAGAPTSPAPPDEGVLTPLVPAPAIPPVPPPPMASTDPVTAGPASMQPGRVAEASPRAERNTPRAPRAHGAATATAPVALARIDGPTDPIVAPGDPVASTNTDPAIVAAATTAGRRAAEPEARDPKTATGEGTVPAVASAPGTVERTASTATGAPDATSGASPGHARLDAETGTPQWQRELGQRLVESAAHGVREMRLQLQPEHLGPLEVRLRLHDTQVGVWFGATSGEVRDALQDSMPRLREMFAEGGLTMSGASVGQHSGGAREHATAGSAPGESRPAVASFAPVAETSRARPSSGRLIDAYA